MQCSLSQGMCTKKQIPYVEWTGGTQAYKICYIYHVYTGKTTISNDGATIMKQLDVAHPAAKTLVDISLSQDAEVHTVVCVCLNLSHL